MDTLNNYELLRQNAGGFKKSNALARFKEANQHNDSIRKSQLIALRILRAIRKKGWSQKQLSDNMGVSPQVVSKWVKGKENFTLETIEKIEKALAITLIDIADEKKSVSAKVITRSEAYNTVMTYATTTVFVAAAAATTARQDHAYTRLSVRKSNHYRYGLIRKFA